MSHTPTPPGPGADSSAPTTGRTRFERMRRAGAMSWSLLGIILLVIAMWVGFSALSTILVPLIIAVILGAVLEPVVNLLTRWRLSTALASVVTLLLTLLVGGGIVALVIAGLVKQLPEVFAQMSAGWESAITWLEHQDVEPMWLERGWEYLTKYSATIGQGAFGVVAGTLTGTVSLAIGLFFAGFFLFFVLRDRAKFPAWFAGVTDTSHEVIATIDREVSRSFRGYFKGTAVTALITAPIFMIPVLLLKVPLAIPMFILYFFLSFIPYLGAWITGAFAILIAFGSGGAGVALIIALSLLLSNGVIQNVVSSWALGSSLRLHPVTVLLATLIGGTVAGLLGMVMGPPLLAAVSASLRGVRELKRSTDFTP